MLSLAVRMVVVGSVIAAVLVLVACGESATSEAGSSRVDPTPEKLDGSSSYEFEQEDVERAESASPEVKAYCEGAVSEAQEVGCLSHVDESDIP